MIKPKDAVANGKGIEFKIFVNSNFHISVRSKHKLEPESEYDVIEKSAYDKAVAALKYYHDKNVEFIKDIRERFPKEKYESFRESMDTHMMDCKATDTLKNLGETE